MVIRKAIDNDLNSILELNHNLFELEFDNLDNTIKVGWTYKEASKDYFLEAIKNDIILVAEEENKIIGYLAGSIVNTPYLIEKERN